MHPVLFVTRWEHTAPVRFVLRGDVEESVGLAAD